MQLLILQIVDPTQAVAQLEFSQSIGVMSAMLKAEGFDCRLAALNGYKPALLKETIVKHRPMYVLIELSPYTIAAARRTIADIEGQFSLPVAVFGKFATCLPSRAISMPGTEALLLGECEHSAVDFMKAFRNGGETAGIPGTWVKTHSGLIKGELRPLVENLDTLPFADRELFDYGVIVARTHEASFKAARGCPQWCAYCVNDWYMDLYAEGGTFVRRRSVDNLLDEIEAVLSSYAGIKSISFYDHCFAMDEHWLEEFAAKYPQRFKLPYRCHVRLNRVTPDTARLLAKSGCRWAHTMIGAGSTFICDEILSMNTTKSQVAEACRLLADAKLTIAAEIFVGNPYESEITLEETINLLNEAPVHEIHPRVFYPTPGTRAAELCGENGWISGRGEEGFWAQQSILDMQSMPAAKINAIARKLPSLSKRGSGTALRNLLGKVIGTRRKGLRGLLGG